MSAIVSRCADVTYDMAGEGLGEPSYEAEIGDLLWNPKGGDGHVLVAEVPCGTGRIGRYGTPADCGCGGWGAEPCSAMAQVCECGEDNASRDHHYVILSRRAAAATDEKQKTADKAAIDRKGGTDATA